MAEQRYKSKPLESWQKAKELRLNLYKDIATAKERGKVLVSGGTEGLIVLASGYDSVFFGGEPYGASAASMHGFALECQEAAEGKGFARDLCGYMRTYFGSMFLDRYAFGGPFPKPDFFFQTHICDTHSKWYVVTSEYEGVPYFCIDLVPYRWEEDEAGKKLKLEYLVGQMHDSIEWMEKITGKKYDDERFIQAVNNECRSTSLWARICCLNKNIPAPLDEKSMFSFYVLAVLMRPEKRIVDFYQTLLAEVEDRVANQIAAVPTERCRLLHDSQPPWHALQIFRYLERYGVVSVGAHYSLGLSGGWAEQEDGSWGPAKTPEEQGIVLRTRDDAIWTLAEWVLETHSVLRSIRYSGPGKNELIKRLAREWHVDGAMIHLNRGCEGLAVGQMELRLALLAAGIPVMTYEGNVADPREFDEAKTLARIDAFMETLGLSKLEN
ncbi:MAG: benzoyl-CoA reductase, bzd-type, subunit O [Dehalococcoidia bacterium]